MKVSKFIYRFSLGIFLFAYCAIYTNVKAQDAKQFQFGIRSGPAIPFGQLVSQKSNTAGFASLGFSASAEGIWYFRPHLGIGFSVALTSLTFEDYAYAHYKVNSEPDMNSLYLKSDNYQARTYSAGLYYSKSISSKLSLTGKLAGGLFWAKTPDQLYSANVNVISNSYPFLMTTTNVAYKITPSRSIKAAFQPGVACRYQLFDQVDLSFNADYTIAVAGFRFQTATSTYVRNLTFSYVNAMLGIDFRF
jgi:hypothetical protein